MTRTMSRAFFFQTMGACVDDLEKILDKKEDFSARDIKRRLQGTGLEDVPSMETVLTYIFWNHVERSPMFIGNLESGWESYQRHMSKQDTAAHT